MEILVTGAAGFIGYHLSNRLLGEGHKVIGIDNLNDYYDVFLKKSRLNLLKEHSNFNFYKSDLINMTDLEEIFKQNNIDIVVNLAAQAGVRYSLENPKTYIDSNIVGFGNLLESCRKHNISHLMYASSSSVYGSNKKIPFSIHDNVDHPVSLYAATKKANELMAHTYSHLYNIPTTGLRFFTVYGPWGRPDMAYFSFTKNILEGNPIKVFNNGNMKRDFTYVDDIIEGVIRLLNKVPSRRSEDFKAPYKIYNIGNNQPVKLLKFINILEDLTEKKAKMEFLPMQPGDVESTYADISELVNDIDFSPNTSLEEGLKKFIDWYLGYYNHLSYNN